MYYGANLFMASEYPDVDVFEEVGRLNELYDDDDDCLSFNHFWQNLLVAYLSIRSLSSSIT